MKCRSCGANVGSRRADSARKVAWCTTCDAIFPVADIPRPSNVEVRSEDDPTSYRDSARFKDRLVMEWKDHPNGFVIIILFVIALSFTAVDRWVATPEATRVRMLATFLVMAGGIGFMVIMNMMRRRLLILERGELTIRTKGLFGGHGESMQLDSISGFFCRARRKGKTVVFSVHARRKDGASDKLFEVVSSHHALFVEREMTGYLEHHRISEPSK